MTHLLPVIIAPKPWRPVRPLRPSSSSPPACLPACLRQALALGAAVWSSRRLAEPQAVRRCLGSSSGRGGWAWRCRQAGGDGAG
jgi:hypothetical protein